jgi:hypothetical protein
MRLQKLMFNTDTEIVGKAQASRSRVVIKFAHLSQAFLCAADGFDQ